MIGNRFVDKNLSDAMDRFQEYDKHQQKLATIKNDLERRKVQKTELLDLEMLARSNRMLNNRLKSHEFKEHEKIYEIKKQNQKLLDRLMEISQGKQSLYKFSNKSTTRKSNQQQEISPDITNSNMTRNFNNQNSQQHQFQTINYNLYDQQSSSTNGIINKQIKSNNQKKLGNQDGSEETLEIASQQLPEHMMSTMSNNGGLSGGRSTIFVQRSLHYISKKKEAERIDFENRKIMKTIVSTGPVLSVKKLEEEHKNRQRIKRNLQKSHVLPIEGFIKRRKDILNNALPPVSIRQSRHLENVQSEDLNHKEQVTVHQRQLKTIDNSSAIDNRSTDLTQITRSAQMNNQNASNINNQQIMGRSQTRNTNNFKTSNLHQTQSFINGFHQQKRTIETSPETRKQNNESPSPLKQKLLVGNYTRDNKSVIAGGSINYQKNKTILNDDLSRTQTIKQQKVKQIDSPNKIQINQSKLNQMQPQIKDAIIQGSSLQKDSQKNVNDGEKSKSDWKQMESVGKSEQNLHYESFNPNTIIQETQIDQHDSLIIPDEVQDISLNSTQDKNNYQQTQVKEVKQNTLKLSNQHKKNDSEIVKSKRSNDLNSQALITNQMSSTQYKNIDNVMKSLDNSKIVAQNYIDHDSQNTSQQAQNILNDKQSLVNTSQSQQSNQQTQKQQVIDDSLSNQNNSQLFKSSKQSEVTQKQVVVANIKLDEDEKNLNITINSKISDKYKQSEKTQSIVAPQRKSQKKTIYIVKK
eukprot:403341493